MEITAVPQLSSIGRRFVAMLLDCIILMVPSILFHLVIPFLGPFLLGLCYQPVLEASPVQATLGKRAMGIMVTTVSGGRLTIGMSFLRYLVGAGSACALFLGHLVAFFSVRKQALHDLVADTLVIRGSVADVNPAEAWKNTLVSLFTKSGSQPSSEVLSRIEKLQELRSSGAISDEEFTRLKAEILRSV
jgi:uncharacterized RDD family membrane protein YckC